MALNSMGAGITISAKDEASAAFRKARESFLKLNEATKQGVDASRAYVDANGRLRDVLTGRYAKAAGKAEGSTSELAGGLSTAGKSMMTFGGGALVAFGMAAQAAADMEKAVATVRTIADPAQFSAESIKALGDSMSSTFGSSSVEQVNTLYSALSNGASSAAEATALLETANKLAIGGSASVEGSMAGLMSTISAYGMKMTEAEKVSDLFFTAVNKGAADLKVEVLAKQFSGVSSLAGNMGVSLQDTLGALTQITLSGTNTSEAVTELKNVINAIIKPSTKASAEAKKLGIDFSQAGLKSMGFAGMLNAINSSGKKTPETLKNLFGENMEAFGGVLKILSGEGESFNKILEEMGKSGGATSKAFDIMDMTASQAAAILRANLGQALRKIGEAVGPVFGALGMALNTVITAFNKMPAGLRNALVQFALVASIAIVVVGGILAVVGAVAGFIATMGPAAAVAAMVAIGLTEVAMAAGLFGGALVTALKGSAFMDYLDQLRGKAELVYDGLVQLFSSGRLSGAVLTALDKPGNDGLKNLVVNLFAVGKRIQLFFESLGKGLSASLSTLDFDGLKGAVSGLLSLFDGLMGKVGDGTASWNLLGDAGQDAGRAIGRGIAYVVDVTTDAINAVKGFISGFRASGPTLDILWVSVSRVGNALGALAASFGSTSNGADSAGGAWARVGQVVGFVAGGIVSAINFISLAVTGLIVIFTAVSSTVGSVFGGLFGVIGGVVQAVSGILTGDWSMAWDGAKMVVFGFVKAILGALMGVASLVAGVVDMIASATGKKGGFQKAVEGGKASLLGGIEKGLGLDQERRGIGEAAQKPYTGDIAATPPPMFKGAKKAEGPPTVYDPASGAPLFSPVPSPAAGGAKPPAAAAAPAPGGQMPLVAPAPPVTINSQIQLTVDGQVLAEVVDRHSTSGSARSFGATAAPT